MQKVLKVDGMTCQHCAQTVSDVVGKLAGIQKVEVNLEKKEVSVKFDESQTGSDEISSKITALGFEVVKV